MTPVLILSGGLMVLMAVVEGLNFWRTRRITFLTAAHALIAAAGFISSILPIT